MPKPKRNAKCHVPNAKFQSQMPLAKCQMLNAKCQMPNAQCQMPNANAKCQFRNPDGEWGRIQTCTFILHGFLARVKEVWNRSFWWNVFRQTIDTLLYYQCVIDNVLPKIKLLKVPHFDPPQFKNERHHAIKRVLTHEDQLKAVSMLLLLIMATVGHWVDCAMTQILLVPFRAIAIKGVLVSLKPPLV